MKLQPCPLVCLPGFLGAATDFDALQSWFSEVDAIDLCGLDAPHENETWDQWEQRFENSIRSKYEGRKIVLAGYSMGARVALRLARRNPDFLEKLVLLSCHPGISDDAGRLERAQNDDGWAHRFRSEPWQQIMLAWNSQTVLALSAARHIPEESFDRQILARTLETFSLAKQTLLSNLCIELPTLICWGDRDRKFAELAQRLGATCRQPTLFEIRGSGHRLLVDNPSATADAIARFCDGTL